MIETALSGLKVIDLTRYIAGPYCTKLLADYGADVMKVERPGTGDGARRLGPFPGDLPDAEKSLLFLHLNANKRGVTLDLESREGTELFKEMVRGADVLVESFMPKVMPGLGLSYETLKGVNPALVMVSVSDFGQTGPYRDYRGSELVDHALGGALFSNGIDERYPIKLGGHVTQYYAGVHAAAATVVALVGRQGHGGGDHVDISIMETQAGSPDRRGPMLIGYQFTKTINQRRILVSASIRPCKDGYVNISTGGSRMGTLAAMMEMPELAEDPRFTDPVQFANPENVDMLNTILLGWLLDRTKSEVLDAAQKAHVLAGTINTTEDILADRHFKARGFWEEIDHPSAGRLTYSGRPFATPGVAHVKRRPAPLLGQHNKEVLTPLRTVEKKPGTNSGRSADATGARTPYRRPLEGVRIIDMTLVLAGTGGAMWLADWGAEVIRVEPRNIFQPLTRGIYAHPSKASLEASKNWVNAYPDWTPGEHPWNRFPLFHSHGRNKLSMTLNLGKPEALEVFMRLVNVSDVVMENNVPETIEKLGVSYEELRKVRPDIIMVRMPAYGLSGPYSHYRSLGQHLEGAAGHTFMRGYADLDPSMNHDVFLGDATASANGALAVALALQQRRRTGKGQLVEMAQTEALIPYFGDALLDFQANGRIAQAQGNDLYDMAPHNVYPCKGEERWVAIAVANDQEWQAMVEVMGDPAWAFETRFGDQPKRYEHRRELDELVGMWTGQQDNRWVMGRLQQAGIPAGVVNDDRDAYEDPQLGARGFFQELTHAETGTNLYPGIIWKMANTPNEIRRPPPLLGEHNDHVYRDLLQLTDEEYSVMEENGHIGMDYEPQVL